MDNDIENTHNALVTDLRQLINSARQRAAVAVNAELTLLYWQIGCRIRQDVLHEQRAEYGQQIIETISKHLTSEYGPGWSVKQLRHCLRIAETFSDEATISTLRRQTTSINRKGTP